MRDYLYFFFFVLFDQRRGRGSLRRSGLSSVAINASFDVEKKIDLKSVAVFVS